MPNINAISCSIKMNEKPGLKIISYPFFEIFVVINTQQTFIVPNINILHKHDRIVCVTSCKEDFKYIWL